MMEDVRFILDTSTTMSWCFEDEADAYGDAVLDSLKESPAAVPSLWILDVANVLLASERRKRMTAEESEAFIQLLAELPIYVRELDTSRMMDLLTIGREFSLSSYDTAFLMLAKDSGLPLATRDSRLRQAADRIGIPLYDPKTPGTSR